MYYGVGYPREPTTDERKRPGGQSLDTTLLLGLCGKPWQAQVVFWGLPLETTIQHHQAAGRRVQGHLSGPHRGVYQERENSRQFHVLELPRPNFKVRSPLYVPTNPLI